MGDFQAHISRFSEYALSDAAVGLCDSRVGVFVYELEKARDGAEFCRSAITRGVDVPRLLSLCLWISICNQCR